jgi:adenine-specific DNA-methyltransferase
MAKVEDLIKSIPDAQLRDEIAREVAKLKSEKKFGLVFEEHLPEQVLLPSLLVKPGVRVVKRGAENEVFTVVAREEGKRTANRWRIVRETNGQEEFALEKELVVIKKFGEPIYPTLVPVDRVTRAPGKPYHTVINAENFHALQLLLYCYEGQVDVIYIDPPYNTGAHDWKYNNNYVDNADSFRHSKWLSMMKRRLKLSSRLLKPDGLLIVTVDDNELRHLWVLIESILPGRKIFPITIQHNPGGTQGDQFSVTHEYALFVLTKSAIVYPQDHLGGETYNLRRWGSTSSRFEAENCFYPIYVKDDHIVKIGDIPPDDFSPTTQTIFKENGVREVWPIDKSGVEKKWRYARQTVESVINRAFVIETPDRTEIKLRRESEKPKTVWTDNRYNAEAFGTDLVSGILQKKFPYPKSLYAEHDCLLAAARGIKDALILDFFAGSGTTLHAVNLLNASDDGKRRCILITNNEVSEEEGRTLKKQGYKEGDEAWERHGIAESVTWPRIKLSILGERHDGAPLEGDYVTSKIQSRLRARAFKQIGFAESQSLMTAKKRKELAALIGVPQSAMVDNVPYLIFPAQQATILFDVLAVEDWLTNLEGEESIKTLYIVTSTDTTFRNIKARASDLLGQVTVLAREKRPMADGFKENAAYFRLDFLDPNEVAYGERFEAIVPILWLMAGAEGELHDERGLHGAGRWFIPKKSPYAVLIQEDYFTQFVRELKERPDITHVFLVTDSEEGYREMISELPGSPKTKMLYKSYLENFRINTERNL